MDRARRRLVGSPWSALAALPLLLLAFGTAHALSGSQTAPTGAGMTPGVLRGQVYYAPEQTFMASLEAANGQHFCGGALIDAQWVLTAAHCVSTNQVAKIRVGSDSVTEGGEVRAPARELYNSGFDLHSDAAVNDIALIRLDQPVKARPVVLAAPNPPPGAGMRMFGWGGKFGASGAPVADTLLQMDTLVDKMANCPFGSGTDVCLGDPENPTASGCKGDSGGPVVVASQTPGGYALAGVVSRAGGDGDICSSHTLATNAPLLRGWIEANVGHALP